MSEKNKEHEDLQFDKADFSAETEQQATTCAVCQNPLGSSYYKINQSLTCPNCKETVEEQSKKGSGISRYFGAILFGLPTAILGALLYYGILALTGYEFGLIAILIGWAVGVAVRKGSNYRGGLIYQLLAVLLTYCAICSTYVPYIIQGMEEEDKMQRQEVTETVPTIETAPAAPLNNSAAADTENLDEYELIDPLEMIKTGTLPQKIVIYAMLLIFSLAVPFMSGFQNIIGMIIIGIGIYQAWIMNKKIPLQIEGPFERKI